MPVAGGQFDSEEFWRLRARAGRLSRASATRPALVALKSARLRARGVPARGPLATGGPASNRLVVVALQAQTTSRCVRSSEQRNALCSFSRRISSAGRHLCASESAPESREHQLRIARTGCGQHRLLRLDKPACAAHQHDHFNVIIIPTQHHPSLSSRHLFHLFHLLLLLLLLVLKLSHTYTISLAHAFATMNTDQETMYFSNNNNNNSGAANNNMSPTTNGNQQRPQSFHLRSTSFDVIRSEPTNGIIRIHSDSQQSLDRLFNPSTTQATVPLRNRNLPASFFNPAWKTDHNNDSKSPQGHDGQSRQLSFHSRSTSFDLRRPEPSNTTNGFARVSLHMRTQSTPMYHNILTPQSPASSNLTPLSNNTPTGSQLQLQSQPTTQTHPQPVPAPQSHFQPATSVPVASQSQFQQQTAPQPHQCFNHRQLNVAQGQSQPVQVPNTATSHPYYCAPQPYGVTSVSTEPETMYYDVLTSQPPANNQVHHTTNGAHIQQPRQSQPAPQTHSQTTTASQSHFQTTTNSAPPQSHFQPAATQQPSQTHFQSAVATQPQQCFNHRQPTVVQGQSQPVQAPTTATSHPYYCSAQAYEVSSMNIEQDTIYYNMETQDANMTEQAYLF